MKVAKLLFAVYVAAVLFSAAAASARSSTYSVRLTHRVDRQVQRANGCRPWIGRPRFPVRRTYAKHSSAWRRGSLRVWRRRANRCGLEQRRVGVPPWFRRVMMCVHGKEADWFNNGHHEGGLQFAYSTWVSAGGPRFAPHAYQATPNEQIRAAWDLTHGSARGLRWHWQQTIGGCL